jgi:hypothetical protein
MSCPQTKRKVLFIIYFEHGGRTMLILRRYNNKQQDALPGPQNTLNMAFEYCPVSRKVLDISPSPRHSAPQLRRLRLAFQSILSIKGK